MQKKLLVKITGRMFYRSVSFSWLTLFLPVSYDFSVIIFFYCGKITIFAVKYRLIVFTDAYNSKFWACLLEREQASVEVPV